MSATIDKRIVEMAFENSQFEKNVGGSLGTIDKLKKALNFGDAAKSFDQINASASRVNLSSMADGIQKISSHFSAMGIIAITTLANIANSAYQAGARIVKALTVDPINAGLQEYETKLNAIQTILANTQKEGTNLEVVTKALNDLNAYADKTIYNFQQMTRNVGTFTAAGVKLDTAVASIKGIANLAAISGSSAEQASNAMYQLSQALSTGTVKLMDWNSVVNSGMGGQVFQDAVIETARVNGVAIDQMIKDAGSFRASLEKGWFTSKILSESLAKFTGDLNADQLRTMGYSEDQIASIIKLGQTANDAATKVKTFSQLFSTLKEAAQSGWAQTWEIIIGDFNEAKSFLTDLNNWFGGILGSMSDVRNSLLSGWKDMGGRTALLESLKNVLNAIVLVINPIREGFRDIFPAATAKQLYTLSLNIRRFTENLIIGGETADKIKRIFKGLFAFLDIGRMAIVAVGKAFFGLTGSMSGYVDSFSDFLAKVGDWAVKLRDNIKDTNAFGEAVEKVKEFFKNIKDVVDPIIEKISSFFSSIKDGLGNFKGLDTSGVPGFFKTFGERLEPLGRIGKIAGKGLEIIAKILEKLAPFAILLGTKAADGIGNFLDNISETIENIDYEKLFDGLNTGLLAALVLAVRKFFNKGSEVFGGISGLLGDVKDSLKAWQTDLKADTLLKIAGALAILTGSVLVLSLIDSKKLTGALTAMTVMFAELGLSLSAFQKTTSLVSIPDMGKMAVGLLAISSAMLILSFAVSVLGKMDSQELIKGIVALGILVGMAKITSKTLSDSSGNMITGAIGLTIFAVSIGVLGIAVKKLGDLDVETLRKGLLSVGILMTELALFMKTTDLSGMGIIKSVGILILAGAVNLLAIAVGQMAKIDDDAIAKGLLAMGVIFAELSAFIALTGGAPGLILTAVGVGVISLAMVVLADVLKKIGDLSWEQIAKGLTAMAIALILIGAAAYLIPPTLIVQAAGMVVMAEALVILSKALSSMGSMSWDEIARGLVVLGGSLLILSLGMTAMSGSLAGSAALLIAAAALTLLAPALKMLGSMSWEELGRSLLALAGVFIVLGIAGAVMTPVVPTLLALGAAMMLIGLGTALAGVGLLAFSAGLAALAISGGAGATALVFLITSVVGLIPMLVKTLGRALLLLIDVLVAGAPTLLRGLVAFLNILLDGLIEIIPKVVDVVITLIDTLLLKLSEKLPSIVQSGYDIILAFLSGMSNNIGDIVFVVATLISNFMDALAEKIPEITQSGWNLIISWVDGMKAGVEDNLPTLMTSVQELGLAIIKGIIQGLLDGRQNAIDAIKDIGKMLIESFKERLGIHSPSSVFYELVGFIIQGLLNGIKDRIMSVKTAAQDLANGVSDAVKEKIDSMRTAGKDLVLGLADGIKSYISEAVTSAAELAAQVLATIKAVFDSKSPSKATFDIGGDVDQGLANGVDHFAGRVLASVTSLGKDALNGFTGVVSKISEAVNNNMDANPTIRPVLDLSEIQNGSNKIDGLLKDKRLNMTVATLNAASVKTASSSGTEPTASGQQTGTTAPAVQFTQNNYSPKTLSRTDIYRQTKNILSQAKEVVGAQ